MNSSRENYSDRKTLIPKQQINQSQKKSNTGTINLKLSNGHKSKNHNVIREPNLTAFNNYVCKFN
jgi:hypothetical protein